MKTCRKCKTEFEGKRCLVCKKAYKVVYLAANRDKDNIANKKYKAENKEKVAARSALRYVENKEHRKLIAAAYYEKNKVEIRKKCKAWAQANPEKCVIRTQNRSAKKRENGGTLSYGLAKRLVAMQKGKCPCCLMPLGVDYQLDHIIPISKGGVNKDYNIQLLRRECNARKGAMDPIDYMQSKGKLL